MFCVFGKSRPLAKIKIQKSSYNGWSVISRVLRKLESLTQRDKQIIIDGYVDIEFLVMKPKKCTCEFAAPEFAKEAYQLMACDKSNFSELTLMKKQKKTKGVMESKKTGKALLEWVVCGL